MAAVLPTQAGQTQAVSAETRVLVENLFQGTTEAAYRQLWEGLSRPIPLWRMTFRWLALSKMIPHAQEPFTRV